MLAIIGGTGLTELDCFAVKSSERVATPYSHEPVVIELLELEEGMVAFLPRHGKNHTIPPHKINYRANIDALEKLGVREIIALNAVGGIHADLAPGSYIVPHQIVDYTHSRISTFYEEDLNEVVHIDFANPFEESLRQRLLKSTAHANQKLGENRKIMNGGVYACTQGPRLETAAEIVRLQRDGCDIVGMTAMPEAALAREKQLPYALLAQSVNWAAGLYPEEITMEEIRAIVAEGLEFTAAVIQDLLNTE